MESVTGAGVDSDGLADELRGTGRGCSRVHTDASDRTDASDFTPAQLEMMKRTCTIQTAPLPRGVQDVAWQPPTSTGLQHSAPILDTEADPCGRIRVTGVNLNNCHFRSWQEDNGVAGTFASETVEKCVDGQRRSVKVALEPKRPPARLTKTATYLHGETTTMPPRPRTNIVLPDSGIPSPLAAADSPVITVLSSAMKERGGSDSLSSGEEDRVPVVAMGTAAGPSSSPTAESFEKVSPKIVRQDTKQLSPNAGISSPLVTADSPVRTMLLLATKERGSSDSLPSGEEVGDPVVAAGTAAGPSLPPTGEFIQNILPTTLCPSKDAVTDVEDGKRRSENGGSIVVAGDTTGPSSIDGSGKQISSTARSASRTLTEVASDAPEGTDSVKDKLEENNYAIGKVTAGPSLPPADAPTHQFLPTPRRPSSDSASSHARQSPRGRSLSRKVVNNVSALTERQDEAEAEHWHPPVTPSSEAGGRAVEEDEGRIVEGNSGVAATPVQNTVTAIAKAEPDEVVGAERTGGVRDGRAGREEETEGRPRHQVSSVAHGEETEKGTRKLLWWGKSRPPTEPPQEQPREKSQEPAQESELPAAVSSSTGNRAAPERRSCLSFRLRRSGNAA